MYVRVTHGQYDPAQTRADAVQAASEPVVEVIKSLPGFISYQGGLNRETGAIIAISTWQDEASATFPREALGDAIANLMSVGLRLEPPAFYEVTITA